MLFDEVIRWTGIAKGSMFLTSVNIVPDPLEPGGNLEAFQFLSGHANEQELGE